MFTLNFPLCLRTQAKLIEEKGIIIIPNIYRQLVIELLISETIKQRWENHSSRYVDNIGNHSDRTEMRFNVQD